ncbi:MAG: hypothetical protein JWN40_1391 [Phycisphaerales bacterium]|nr:hypothetical protein [Phycisphaerales bacterium]
MQGGSENVGLCWDCNYSLRGIESRRCPECGRAFDPADPRSMNMGQPRGPIGRWAVRPVSWVLVAAAVVATGLILLVTRPPVWWREAWFIDLAYFGRWRDRKLLWAAMGEREVVYVLGVLMWVLIMGGWWLGAGVRWVALLRFRGGVAPLRTRRRHVLLLTLMTISVLAVGLGWPYRMGKLFVRQAMAAAPAMATTTAPKPGARRFAHIIWAPGMTPPAVKRALWAVALQGGSQRERLFALQMLAERFGDDVGWTLKDALCRSSSDAAMRVWELRLFGLYGPPEAKELAEKYMDDADADVRAAAADAVGMLHGGLEDSQLAMALTWSALVTTRSDPPIHWSYRSRHGRSPGTWFELIPRSKLSEPLRQRLSKMMVNGETTDEREAAARSLVDDPPPGYRLRLAEWGVWQSRRVDDEELLSGQLDEIPPLAHAVGDSVAGLTAARSAAPTIVWKPVIHLSTDAPMAVDLRVRLLRGRPWYVYPMPDDFDLQFRTGSDYGRTATRPVVQRLDPTGLKPLDPQMREGYPWLTPGHLNGKASIGYGLAEVGFRWQSLIVSPTKLGWMHEVAVGDDARFHWWKHLREVDSAWVSNRGESERFLYYDGPTMITSPVAYSLVGGQLVAGAAPRPADAEAKGFNSRPVWAVGYKATRDALLIRVKNGAAALAERMDVPVVIQPDMPGLHGRKLPGGAEAALTVMLRERGLTPSEAAGMIAAWRKAFFEKEGTRLLIMMTQSDYDTMCPLAVRPTPTEVTRVGVIWVELQ